MTDEHTPEDTPDDAGASNGSAGPDVATAVAVAAPSTGDKLVAWLGEENAERPMPSLMAAFAGIGGVMAALGLMVAIAGDDNSPRGKILVISVLLLALALAVRLMVKLPPFRAAAVGIAVVAIPAFSIAATVSDGTSTFLTGAVLAVLAIAAWALPGFRNAHILLAIGALALVSAFGSLTAPDNNASKIAECDQYNMEGDYDAFDEAGCYDVYYADTSTSFLPGGVTDNLGEQGAVYLGGAALFFGLTWWLDRRRRRGPGAALAAAGLLSALSGTALLAADFSDDTAPLLVLAVGLVLCIVGTHGGRRATTWWGAALASIGLVAEVAIQWKPDSTGASGGTMIVTGLILFGTAAIAATVQGAQTDQPAEESPEP